MAEEIRLELLGGLRVTRCTAGGEASVLGFATSKAQALFVYLVVTGRPHFREALAGLLWGESSDEAARASLRQALTDLRRLVGDHLAITRTSVAFNAALPYALDVAAFTDGVRHAKDGADSIARLREATALYRGDFLAGFGVSRAPAFEEWVAAERERLRQLMLGALGTLAAAELAGGDDDGAFQTLGQLLALAPWREDAHRQLMLLLAGRGQRAAALSQYERCRQALAADLGVEPEPETTALYQRIRAGTAVTPPLLPVSPDGPWSPVSPPARVPTLPVPLTPLLGRLAEQAEIASLLADPACRLLTLVGPGGVGKTRLALDVAQRQKAAYAAGTRFVPLALVADPALVADAILRALGSRTTRGVDGDGPPLDRLTAELSDQELLLVLDNFEHVVAAAPLVAELLAACPRLKVLATSRMPLRLRGEHELPVSPLALPELTPRTDPASLIANPAVALFAERAGAVRRDFALTETNAATVAAICIQLDGLPLALELAAARVKTLAPAALLPRLSRRLGLLTGGPRDLPARHQTMRGAIAWSYDLLDEGEQQLFRRLGVFSGGATLPAIQAVCAPDDAPDADLDLLDGVASLVDKCLLRQIAGDDEEPRFIPLETIREYALERLEASGEAHAIRRRHANVYLALAEAAAPELRGRRLAARLAQLEAEHANLSAALHWCAEHDPATGLRLAVGLSRFWLLRGYWGEGRGWLELLLRRAGLDVPARVRAQAFSAQGHLATTQGDTPAARALLLEGVAIWRRLGDRHGLADALHWLGREYASPEAEGWLRESLALYRELADERGSAEVLGTLGENLRQGGDIDAARRLGEESLARWRALGDAYYVALQLYRLGHIARHQRDDARARTLYDEALVLNRQVGHRWGVAMTLVNLGFVEQRAGDPARAVALAHQSLQLNHELDNKWGVCRGLHVLAAVAVARSRPDDAAHVARLLGAAEALRLITDTTWQPNDRDEVDQWAAVARSAMGEEAFASVWAEGRAMSVEQAVAYALEEPSSTR